MTIDNSPEISCPVIVLAGGLGTRLRSVTQDKPKILAPLPHDPAQTFLIFYLRWLQAQGVRRVIFSLGYQASLVVAEIERLRSLTEFASMRIDYVIEPKPLGTLGAMRYTLQRVKLDAAVILNGDTILDMSLRHFVLNAEQQLSRGFSFAAIYQADTRRFGRAEFDENQQLVRFQEKQLDAEAAIAGWINAGVYFFTKSFIQWVCTTVESSFETRCLQADNFEQPRHAFLVKSEQSDDPVRFIDIGTPASWKTLTDWLPNQENIE